jgi:hypothetical protein
VLLHVAAHPEATLRQTAPAPGITGWRGGRLVGDLAGYLVARRVGRRNTYAVDRAAAARHPTLASVPLRG